MYAHREGVLPTIVKPETGNTLRSAGWREDRHVDTVAYEAALVRDRYYVSQPAKRFLEARSPDRSEAPTESNSTKRG